jgi:hypothetical protein
VLLWVVVGCCGLLWVVVGGLWIYFDFVLTLFLLCFTFLLHFFYLSFISFLPLFCTSSVLLSVVGVLRSLHRRFNAFFLNSGSITLDSHDGNPRVHYPLEPHE